MIHKVRIPALLASLALLWLTAPGLGAQAAAPDAEKPAAESATGGWRLDSASSQVSFYVRARLTNVRGYFRSMQLREFTMNGSDPASMRGRIAIQTASVFSRDRKRDEHLRQDDFFWSARFPDAYVIVDGISQQEGRTMINFTLKIRDKQQSYTAPVDLSVSGDTIRAAGSLQVNRQHFDLTGELAANLVMDDTVDLTYRIVLKKG